MDTPCDQRGLRRRGRLDEPQGDYLSMSHGRIKQFDSSNHFE
jgi:hypothetical protein